MTATSWRYGLVAVLSFLMAATVARAEDYGKEAEEEVRVLQQWYNPATGLYESTGWWNSANAITVLAEYAKLAKSHEFQATLGESFVAAQKKNATFLNEYYDDEGWWALAWIQAYDTTGRKDYLRMSEAIFADMAQGWDDASCGGGLWWSKKRTYKNAIANELFLSVAGHLANRVEKKQRGFYEDWAMREWRWFQQTGMLNSEGLINDGLTHDCKNNNGKVWTYNQGVILGGLAELSRRRHDGALLEAARSMAAASTLGMVDEDGILHDPCEPSCGADGVQFKGIYVRNLATLERATGEPGYRDLIVKNADSILQHDRDEDGRMGTVWSGPPGKTTAGTHSSALDAIVAAEIVSGRGRLGAWKHGS